MLNCVWYTVWLRRVQGAGGWHHPIHIHLLDYLMLAGTGRDRSEFADWDILTQVRPRRHTDRGTEKRRRDSLVRLTSTVIGRLK